MPSKSVKNVPKTRSDPHTHARLDREPVAQAAAHSDHEAQPPRAGRDRRPSDKVATQREFLLLSLFLKI